MTAYLPGSNIQGGGDTVQTLFLMNPGYSNNPGNMAGLVSPSGSVLGQNNTTFPNSGRQQQQHHFNGFVQHSSLTEASLSQQPPLASVSNGNQSPPAALYTVGVNNQTYSNNWTGTRNELSFLPLSDISQATQSFVARLSSVNGGQESTSMDLSDYSLRQQSLSGIQEQQSSLFSNGTALGLNSQGSSGPGKGLSLSLSPQRNSFGHLQPFQMQPSESGMNNCVGISQLSAEDNSSRDDRFLNRCTGTLSSFRASSRSGTIGNGMQNSFTGMGISRQEHIERDPSSLVSLSGSVLASSKYLKPVQHLLHEVVNVEECIKSSMHVKMQSWMAAGSDADMSFSKSKSLSEISSKDHVGSPTGMPTSNATVIHNTVPSEPNVQNVQELTVPERQELQAKKTKLMAMLDEVDWRYRQYCNQMQIVVTSFESAAGPGAAKTYTALALQTISRHFRCLKSSIRSQIKATSKTLGEEDVSVQVMGSGGLSKLRFVDQQLCEQRALQQLGMMQHNAWRPQRGLPERAVSVLRAWLFEHFLHPYPKDADKSMLARQTGLSRNQVSNWFINARVRLWKPMVEEMYLEETKEAEAEAEMETTSNSQVDNSSSKRRKEEEESTSKSAAASDATEDHHHQKQQQGIINRSESHAHAVPHVHHNYDEVSEKMNNTAPATMLNNSSDMMMMMMTRNQSMSPTPESIHMMRHHPGIVKQQPMMYHDHNSSSSSSFSDPNMGMDMPLPLKSLERCGDQQQQKQTRDLENRHNFGIPSYEAQQALGGEGFGLPYIHLGNLGSYPQEGFRYVPNGGVSLTLGLQHVDSLTSLPGAQNQHYLSNGQIYP